MYHLNRYPPLIKNFEAAVSGEPLMFPSIWSYVDKNSCTSAKSAPKSAASPSALTVPGLLDKFNFR